MAHSMTTTHTQKTQNCPRQHTQKGGTTAVTRQRQTLHSRLLCLLKALVCQYP